MIEAEKAHRQQVIAELTPIALTHLRKAFFELHKDEHTHVIIDGTLIPVGRAGRSRWGPAVLSAIARLLSCLREGDDEAEP